MPHATSRCPRSGAARAGRSCSSSSRNPACGSRSSSCPTGRSSTGRIGSSWPRPWACPRCRCACSRCRSRSVTRIESSSRRRSPCSPSAAATSRRRACQGLLLGLTQAELAAGVLNRGVAQPPARPGAGPGASGTHAARTRGVDRRERPDRPAPGAGRPRGPGGSPARGGVGRRSVKEADRRLAAARTDRPPGGPLILRALPAAASGRDDPKPPGRRPRHDPARRRAGPAGRRRSSPVPRPAARGSGAGRRRCPRLHPPGRRPGVPGRVPRAGRGHGAVPPGDGALDRRAAGPAAPDDPADGPST